MNNKTGNSINKENDLPVVLKELKDAEVFKTPEGYFGNFAERVSARINETPVRKVWWGFRISRVAALIVIMIMIGGGIAGLWYGSSQRQLSEDSYYHHYIELSDIQESDLLYEFMDYEDLDYTNLITEEDQDAILDQILADNHIEKLFLDDK
ncbi:MAG: hypothetical protein KKA81_12810 [Bacteroidetes bacterium]|nr:hypothetical protein [Bacteroidota bacterium]